MASNDSVSSPTAAAAAAAQSEFKFRILANRPDVTAPPPATVTSASGLAAAPPSAPASLGNDLDDDPTAGDETLGDISNVAEYAHVVAQEEEGGGGGASPALASDPALGVASFKLASSERRLDKVRPRSCPSRKVYNSGLHMPARECSYLLSIFPVSQDTHTRSPSESTTANTPAAPATSAPDASTAPTDAPVYTNLLDVGSAIQAWESLREVVTQCDDRALETLWDEIANSPGAVDPNPDSEARKRYLRKETAVQVERQRRRLLLRASGSGSGSASGSEAKEEEEDASTAAAAVAALTRDVDTPMDLSTTTTTTMTTSADTGPTRPARGEGQEDSRFTPDKVQSVSTLAAPSSYPSSSMGLDADASTSLLPPVMSAPGGVGASQGRDEAVFVQQQQGQFLFLYMLFSFFFPKSAVQFRIGQERPFARTA